MALREKLTADMKAAMKARDAARLATIRMLLSDVKNSQIDLGRELTEDEELAFLATPAKKRRESIESFEAGGRDEMAEQEKAELEVIEGYLPEQLSEDEVREIVAEVVAEVGASNPADMGKVMGVLMPRLKGRFPGKQVPPIVQAALRG